MINVSDATKQEYQKDSVSKKLTVTFPNLNIVLSDEDIVLEKFSWEETIFDGDALEFVGCIASYVKLDIIDRRGRLSAINGELITVTIKANNTEEIPIFYGYVTLTSKSAQQYVKSITAYDALNMLADKDVTEWYNSHAKCTVSSLLADLLSLVNIDNNSQTLVNGSLPALCGASPRKASNLSALNLLKAICQINGCCGRIGRTGKFETVHFESKTPSSIYPSSQLLPGNNIYPAMPDSDESTDSEDTDNILLAFYKSLTYEDYSVNAISKVTIRDTSDVEGVSYGTGTNNYIIQGNIFAFDQTDSVLINAASNILSENANFSYIPFESDNNGLPFIECGDFISCYDMAYEPAEGQSGQQIIRDFCVLHRTVEGIHNLRDNFDAEGDKEQKVIISDLGLQLSDVTNQITGVYEQVNELSGTMLKAVSVASVPTSWDANTIYFIRK